MGGFAKRVGQLTEFNKKRLRQIRKLKSALILGAFLLGTLCSPAYSAPLTIDFGPSEGSGTNYHHGESFDASDVTFSVLGNGSAFSWVTVGYDQWTGMEALWLNGAGVNIDFHQPLSYLEFDFSYYLTGDVQGKFDDSTLTINGVTVDAPGGLDELDGQVIGGVTIDVRRTEIPGMADHLADALPFFVISFSGEINSFELTAVRIMTANFSGETLGAWDPGSSQPDREVPEPASVVLIATALIAAGIKNARQRYNA